jgi:hypothetical protein
VDNSKVKDLVLNTLSVVYVAPLNTLNACPLTFPPHPISGGKKKKKFASQVPECLP